jgi:protein TonB
MTSPEPVRPARRDDEPRLEVAWNGDLKDFWETLCALAERLPVLSAPVHPARGGHEPRLAVAWKNDLKEFWAALRALMERLPALAAGSQPEPFRSGALKFERPAQALVLSVLLHVLFVVTPMPRFLTRPAPAPTNAEVVRIEYDLKWMSNSRVLPPITPTPRERKEPSPGGQENEPLPPPGADEIAPQTIVSNPPEPNHPTQTVIHQLAVENARVQTPDLQLPNMVIPPSEAPKAEIDLRRLRIPNAPLDLTGPPQAPQVPRPKSRAELALENTKLENLVPRLAVATSTGEENGEAAPDVQTAPGVPRSGDQNAPGLLALSGNPGAAGPVLELPEANLRARFAVGPHLGSGSPGGVPGGTPGAQGGSGGGPGGLAGGPGGLTAPDVFVAPAGPVPAGPVIAGLSASGSAGTPPPPPAEALPSRPQPQQQTAPALAQQSAAERAEELMGGLTPGTRPGEFTPWRRVYTIYINMPNLTSQTGSWVLRFAEMSEARNTAPGGAADSYPLAAPVPLKKVDPKYPSDLRRMGVEGTVSLYGIIHEDGSVDHVQVVQGLHNELDQNAIEAFKRWRFAPGYKNGAAVALEVVIEIPFRLSKLF